jgi:hypothetical protein
MKVISGIWEYIKKDYNEYPLRFCAEVFTWACSITSATIFAATAPNIPIIPLYVLFMSGCASAAWTCYTRGSVGLLINAGCIFIIDAVGLIRMLLH